MPKEPDDSLKDLEWKKLRLAHLDFERSIAEVMIISRTSLGALKEYPKSLPPALKSELSQKLEPFFNQLVTALKSSQSKQPDEPPIIIPPPNLQEKGVDASDSHTDLFQPTFVVMLSQVLLKQPPFAVDFPRAIYAQQIAMTFAHFDAFMGDILRALIRNNPDLLRRNKEISWKRIIELGGWESLMNEMLEAHVYEFGWKSAPDRIQELRERFGLKLDLSKEELSTITDAELLRHLVMHNGGRVSAEHIRRSGNNSLKAGELIPVDHKKISDITRALRKAASEMFVSISLTIFKKTSEDLTGVARFGPKEDDDLTIVVTKSKFIPLKRVE